MNRIATRVTSRTRRPTAPHGAQKPEAVAVASQPIRRASTIAGVGLLLMSALGPFGIFFEGLVASGDAARTATNIVESESLFRFGIVSLYVVVVLDVVVAWALYRVFRPVNAGFSVLAAWLRLAYTAIFMVAISQLAGALRILGDDYRAVLSADQADAHALLRMETFSDIWGAGFVLFGLHLITLGYLAYRSGFVPRVLGVLLVIAGCGYAFDSVVAVLAPDPWIKVAVVTFVGELLLAFWLVIRGRRLTVNE